MKCSAYIATSLDGFIAGVDGDLSWLEGYATTGLLEYDDFCRTIDVLVMGRKTYETVLSFAEWPYGNLPLVVLSRYAITSPPEPCAQVSQMSGEPIAIIKQLSSQYHHAYIDGGQTIQRFIAAACLDELILTQIPVLLGRGIPLFGALPQAVPLKLTRSVCAESGLVQSHYHLR